MRRIYYNIKIWWNNLEILYILNINDRKNEFHKSLNLDIIAMYYMSKKQQVKHYMSDRSEI